jgi:cytochrome c oxidase assembly factor CtaG
LVSGGLLAHGGVAPDPAELGWLGAWPPARTVWLALAATGWAYWSAARKVPAFPAWRRRCFGAGLMVVGLALASPIDTYDTTLFWVHMQQHLLLTIVAAPLLDMGALLALALRAARAKRRRQLAHILHSQRLQAITHPVIIWFVFVGVLWASHFSPLYNLALDSEAVHVIEHVLYLGSRLLFWWPVVGADPGARRLPHWARLGYLFITMPTHAFLGLTIVSAGFVLYPHYAQLQRSWGPTALEDQQLAGIIMWTEGAFIFIIAFVLSFLALLRHGERTAARVDRRMARLASQWSAAGTTTVGRSEGMELGDD